MKFEYFKYFFGLLSEKSWRCDMQVSWPALDGFIWFNLWDLGDFRPTLGWKLILPLQKLSQMLQSAVRDVEMCTAAPKIPMWVISPLAISLWGSPDLIAAAISICSDGWDHDWYLQKMRKFAWYSMTQRTTWLLITCREMRREKGGSKERMWIIKAHWLMSSCSFKVLSLI